MAREHSIILTSENETAALAGKFAKVLTKGDTVLLSGDIGAGKSFFCRAVLRSVFGAELEVPSPTFTIVQTYEDDDQEYWHCDLYRLTNPDEAIELGLDEAFEEAICLIEWPDRLGDLRPAGALEIHMDAEVDHHRLTVSMSDDWEKRLAHVL